MSKLLTSKRLLAALPPTAALAAPLAAQAQHHGGAGFGGHGAPAGFHGRTPFAFRGRPFGSLRPFELAAWRGGHWWHGAYGGRFGWWWWADGYWYWYDEPIYPYPTVISETVWAAAPRGGAAGPGYSWYWCANPQGYWPYVRSCAAPWQPVPPSPPPH
jgi:hypothetical protein